MLQQTTKIRYVTFSLLLLLYYVVLMKSLYDLNSDEMAVVRLKQLLFFYLVVAQKYFAVFCVCCISSLIM